MSGQRNAPEQPGPRSTVPREVAPVIVLGVGLVGAVLWSGVTEGRAAVSPPYLIAQGLLMTVGFALATRGAPRWSYPWLAFGVAGTGALLGAFVALDAEPSAAVAFVAVAAGPVLAVLLSTVISARSWGDAYAFLGMFLAGLVVSWLMVGPPGATIATVEAGTGQTVALLVVLPVLGAVMAMAVLAWNRGVTEIALVLLGSVLIVSAAGFEVMIPDVPDSETEPPNFASFVSLYLFLGMATFAVGSVRRVFAGKGIVSAAPAPRDPTEAVGTIRDEDDADRDADEEEGDSPRNPGARGAVRPRRRRRRR